MKKLIFFAAVVLVILASSCSFESYSSQCPAYSHNKSTKHGEKAQMKYARRN